MSGRPLSEPWGRRLLYHLTQPGVVVDCDVDVLPVDVAVAIHAVTEDALPNVPEAAELRGVDVQQLVRSLALIAHDRRLQLAPTVRAAARTHRSGRSARAQPSAHRLPRSTTHLDEWRIRRGAPGASNIGTSAIRCLAGVESVQLAPVPARDQLIERRLDIGA